MEIITGFTSIEDVEKTLEIIRKDKTEPISVVWKTYFEQYQNDWWFYIDWIDWIDFSYWSEKYLLNKWFFYWSVNCLLRRWFFNNKVNSKINFQDFLERENKEVFTKWELVEVSDSGIFWGKRIFIEKFDDGYSCVLSWLEDSYNNWKYYNTHLWEKIRKIPQKKDRTFKLTDDEFIKVNDFITNLKYMIIILIKNKNV